MQIDLEYWRNVAQDGLFADMLAPKNRQFVVRMMRSLTPDPNWTELIIDQVEAGRLEVRCVVAWLACRLDPATYLEIGVRRGFTMAMVAAQCPEVELYGFDMWVPGYAGSGNLGPSFVQAEMAKVGYHKWINFISGDSHRTVPAFFEGTTSVLERVGLRRRGPPAPPSIDLILVDGDHTLLGAYQDLHDTLPHCSVGGALVFDDIAADLSHLNPQQLARERGPDPHSWGDLRGVWKAVEAEFPNFRFFEHVANPPGVGVAVRLS